MNKQIIFGILAFCSAFAMAQEKQAKIMYFASSNTDKYVTVDTASVRVWYALNAKDIKDEKSYIDLQILEIGRTRNKYYSQWVWYSDSLMTIERRKNATEVSSSLLPYSRGGRGHWNELQYHTLFIQDGKVRTYTRERDNTYNGYYDETYPGMTWTLCQDTATICDLRCQKATCCYHGRNFEAWFTTEVPLRYGPWKFGGLPGLIVKVYDTDRFYTFECVRVERVNCPMRSSQYKRHRPINRGKVLKYERKINENFYKTSGLKGYDGNLLSKKVWYEPLEKE